MKTTLAAIAALTIVGCDSSHNYSVVNIYDNGDCTEAIRIVTGQYGPPEDIDDTGFTSNGAHVLTYYYYAKRSDLWSVDFIHGTRCTANKYFAQPVYQY